MEVILNGKKTDTCAKNLKEFLLERNIDSTTVATAVDGEFVPRTHHESQPLSAGVKLEVLAPMQGG